MKARYVGLSVLALLSLMTPARSQFEVFPQGVSPLEQTTQADVIVIGTVTDIEEQPVQAERRKGSGKVAHLVGTIRVAETLLGAKGLTHVRVGYVPGIPEIRPDGQKFLG